MGNREILQKELKDNKGKLCLYMLEVVQLLDIVDGEDDYYYKIMNTGREVSLLSCVVGLIPLYKQIPDDDYDMMKNWRQRNVLDLLEDDNETIPNEIMESNT